MSKKTQKQNTEEQVGSLKDSVLSRIERDRVHPIAKWIFVCRECSVWILWGLSVLVGALAVTVTIFISMHAGFAFYEATHDSPFLYFIEALPYLWLVIFALMTLFAYKNLRNTKKGYRYPFVHILVSSLVFSVVGGVALNAAGVGYAIDSGLERVMPMYRSQETIEAELWQRPEEGRLVGVFMFQTPETSVVLFRDLEGNEWNLETKELTKPDMDILRSGNRVRVLGLASTTINAFHGCGAFPWMYDKNITLSDMQSERRKFIERMYAHKDARDERLKALNDEVFVKRMPPEGSLCAEIAVIQRIGENMR